MLGIDYCADEGWPPLMLTSRAAGIANVLTSFLVSHTFSIVLLPH